MQKYCRTHLTWNFYFFSALVTVLVGLRLPPRLWACETMICKFPMVTGHNGKSLNHFSWSKQIISTVNWGLKQILEPTELWSKCILCFHWKESTSLSTHYNVVGSVKPSNLTNPCGRANQWADTRKGTQSEWIRLLWIRKETAILCEHTHLSMAWITKLRCI